ncbi:hypothetical protein BMF94_3864 [Rhodotorula taiwanensis]|uniref:Endoplasmic reticulum transmembrane protein n=1 Tax=Rhodotorula taiwanensis TaxID=741276 RepID=A0A2S5B8C3_9BASI|nr:hypothetical protein BMF94_3864 [Rhodotorula taiwanensis]
MAIQNLIAFGILTCELVTFGVLIVPLPFTWRRALFKAIAESHIIAQIQYGLKITFIFIALLFVDAVNQMLKIHREKEINAAAGGAGTIPDMRTQSEYRSRKFLSERNFYLHGSCLVFSLILSRTYSLVLDLIRAQEELAIIKAQAGNAEAAKIAPKDEKDSIQNLEKKKVKPSTVRKEDKNE